MGDVDAPVLYFLHVPKTGGTAVTRALDAAFPPEEVLDGGLVGDVAALPAATLARHRFLRGHFGLLPLERIGWEDVVSFTLLRDPVERLLSLYAHVREHAAHYLHVDANAQDVSTFLRDRRWMALARNSQARWLAVPPTAATLNWPVPVPRDDPFRAQAAFDLWPHGLDDRTLHDRAAANLRRLSVVGVSEDSASVVARVAARAGIDVPGPPARDNVSRERLRPDDLSSPDLAHLRALTEVDSRLHELAARLAA